MLYLNGEFAGMGRTHVRMAFSFKNVAHYSATHQAEPSAREGSAQSITEILHKKEWQGFPIAKFEDFL